MMLIVTLYPVNFSSWACLKVRMIGNIYYTKTSDIQFGHLMQLHYQSVNMIFVCTHLHIAVTEAIMAPVSLQSTQQDCVNLMKTNT